MSDVPIYNFLLFKIFNSSAFSLKISLTVSVIPLDVLQFFLCSLPWITLLYYWHQFGRCGLQKRWLCTQPSYLQAPISTGEAGEVLVLRALAWCWGLRDGPFNVIEHIWANISNSRMCEQVGKPGWKDPAHSCLCET